MTGIDAQLVLGAEIKGTVTVAGSPVSDGFAVVFDTSGSMEIYGEAGIVDGSYDITGIPAGNFAICFGTNSANQTLGCYNGVAWDGNPEKLPAGITTMKLTAGTTTTINDSLG